MDKLTLDEVKNYLRVDSSDDDELITSLLQSSEELVKTIARFTETDELYANSTCKIAVLYAIAYLYEHREDANHLTLDLTLRALLLPVRKGAWF